MFGCIQFSKSLIILPRTQLELDLTKPLAPLITIEEQSDAGMIVFSPTAEMRAVREYEAHPVLHHKCEGRQRK